MDENSEKRKVGRPATGRAKPRQLGRVPDAIWDKLQAAAKLSGKSFTDWSLGLLAPEADRLLEENRKTRSNE